MQSRYYDPVVGRFINADDTDVLAADQGNILENNLFTYCFNSPINRIDKDGYASDVIRKYGAWAVLIMACIAVVPMVAAVVAGALVHALYIYVGFNLGSKVITALKSKIISLSKRKPINLPSIKKVKIDMPHIWSGHGSGGNRGPNKDRFPKWMTYPLIERAVREAYNNAQKIGGLQYSIEKGVWHITQYFQGYSKTLGGTIKFWFDYTTNTIRTAFPK